VEGGVCIKALEKSPMAQELEDFRIKWLRGGMREWLKRVVLKTDHRHFHFPLFSWKRFESVCLSARGEVVS
jgi:hypothetical protein